MLIDRRNLWKLHGRWIVATSAVAMAAVGWTAVASLRGGRWPGGGSLPGLVLGTLAAVIFVFEMAIVLKRTQWLRTARWALSAQTWMKAHIWLGLLSVPLVVLHSGGRLGGILPTLLVAVFAIVIASGLWGLALQNLVPKLLLEAAPAETIYSQIGAVGEQYAEEARRLVGLAGGDAGHRLPGRGSQSAPSTSPIPGAARQVGTQAPRRPHPASEEGQVVAPVALLEALERHIEPYLTRGQRVDLGSRQRNQWYFDDLRQRVPRELRELVGQLEELCERRRQLDVQQRLHFWLHNWLWVHLSLSVALVALLAGHVVLALRFG